jgi:hypothetical protein
VQNKKPFGTLGRSTLFFLLTRFLDGLQLRRAISTQAEGKKLFDKHAFAPSAARLCFMKGRQEKKTILLAGRALLAASPQPYP